MRFKLILHVILLCFAFSWRVEAIRFSEMKTSSAHSGWLKANRSNRSFPQRRLMKPPSRTSTPIDHFNFHFKQIEIASVSLHWLILDWEKTGHIAVVHIHLDSVVFQAWQIYSSNHIRRYSIKNFLKIFIYGSDDDDEKKEQSPERISEITSKLYYFKIAFTFLSDKKLKWQAWRRTNEFLPRLSLRNFPTTWLEKRGKNTAEE